MAGFRAGVGSLLRTSWRGDLRYFLGGRALRSLSQGYLGIAVPLFLVRVGFSTVSIGVLLTGAAASSAVLTAFVGFAADRGVLPRGRPPV